MENEKFYKCGLVLGRFCHEHAEHALLINTSLALCQTTIVLVGSAQESGTLRNPFDIDTRIEVIKRAHPDIPEKTLMVKGINDLKNEFNNDFSWGKYVKSEVERHTGRFADLIIYGNDPVKRTWYAPEDMHNTAELFIPRSENSLSATLVRALLTIDDKTYWKKITSPLIHEMYEELRAKLLAVPIYKEIYEKIQNDLTLDNFMKVYNEFIEVDKECKLLELN